MNLLDTAIAFVSPSWGVKRAAARATLQQIANYGMGGGGGGYSAGKTNRLTGTSVKASENSSVLRARADNIVWRSWELYRDSPHARKIVRSLVSKVVGRGMVPQSQATNENGSPDIGFRRRARTVWSRWAKASGVHQKAKTGFKALPLTGEFLYKFKRLNADQQLAAKAYLPIDVQLISATRLDSTRIDDKTFYGIEVDDDGNRVAYWLSGAYDAVRYVESNAKRYDAKDIRHVFLPDDIDQLRGVSWFAPILDKTRDIGDYEFNELVASKMAACPVLGVQRSSGQQSIGLQPAGGTGDITDADGNKVTHLSPGMIFDLGNDGKLDGFNPMRPNSGAVEFLQHQLRSVAAGVPGIRPNTLTGDYQGSSFSSEKAADNDIWPELECLQDWFANAFYQPIYEEVITSAVLAGMFDDIPGFTAADFTNYKADYLACIWSGPVARSVNPVNDEQASKMRIQLGKSSPQIEAGDIGNNWQEVLADVNEWIDQAKALNLPAEFIASVMTPNPQLTLQATADVPGDTSNAPA